MTGLRTDSVASSRARANAGRSRDPEVDVGQDDDRLEFDDDLESLPRRARCADPIGVLVRQQEPCKQERRQIHEQHEDGGDEVRVGWFERRATRAATTKSVGAIVRPTSRR